MKTLIPALILTFFYLGLSAQSYKALDTVIVEKYYISDSIDAMDIQYIYNSTGDTILDSLILEPGSVTYRIYVKLKKGCKLTKLYGDTLHQLKIKSTSRFYNNCDRGVSFGQDFKIKNFNNRNTAALDSWLALGMATSSNRGILKKEDKDGSILGKKGYLTNNDTAAGIPLTVTDGLDSVKMAPPKGWLDKGILTGNDDSTIFGSMKFGKSFVSSYVFIKNNGVMGPDTGNNIIVAQLTTHGDLSFELNIEVIDTLNPNLPVHFVAKQNQDISGVIERPCLTYPPAAKPCGCKDPDYVEFNPYYTCSNPDSCIHLKPLVKFGCKDPSACNYDSSVNFHVPELCCYPGLCGGRDISIVCPELGQKQPVVSIYPNPVNKKLSVDLKGVGSGKITLSFYNLFGDKLLENTIKQGVNEIDMSKMASGIYLLQFQCSNGTNIIKYVIKN